ncbi:heme oxygenase [Duganella sp. Leaf126]|uniref:biliverdin-producing heme oxygenase n=1 Tax=Duganella sp. Leaf126 TaxID=1736266 RepID=UPI000700C5B6|nr:biliverdin-producing heme oxygenase [Duganella sp. Leaf126]KQQ33615.1 heme oxygenase [Duganella sp. Leaf126]
MKNEEADVLAALRAATAARHDELDAQTPLAAPDVDLAAYGAHLRLLERWLAPVPAWLASFGDGPVLPDYLGAIRADLAHAALAGLTDDAVAAVPAAPWPAHASAAYRWGVCYVVEGSQLGGAVLYKRLAPTLAPHPLAYLRGNGSPGPRWQQFLAALRTQVVEPSQIADACAGARDAFDRLIALNRALHQAGARCGA